MKGVVGLISMCIEELRRAGFRETAEILAVARLDLLARRYGVSDAELDRQITTARKPYSGAD